MYSLANVHTIFTQDGVLAKSLPYYEYRPGQVDMTRAVADAFQLRQHLIVEAGTGVGKTLAYLIPAIVSGVKTVVSTGTKNLQEQLFFKDIPYLKRHITDKFQATYMKGRSNYLCLKRLHLFHQQSLFHDAADESIFERIQRWAKKTKTGDRGELDGIPETFGPWRDVCCTRETCPGALCEYYKEDCFLYKMRRDAEEADLIIVNHHLFFADLAIKNLNIGEVIPPYEAVIFDEAHLLEDIATSFFSTTVNSYQAEEMSQNVVAEMTNAKLHSDTIPKTLTALQQVSQRFFRHFENPANRYRLRENQIDPQALNVAPDFANTLLMLSAQIKGLKDVTDELQFLARRVEEMKAALELILNQSEPGYVYWCEMQGPGVFLHASPIDVAQDMRQNIFQQLDRIILTSATLSTGNTFDFLKERLGLERPVELIVDSPFNFEQQAMLYLPRWMPEPSHPDFTLAVADEVEKVLEKSRGRAFVLFTSYKNLEDVYERLKRKLPYKVLKQGQKNRTALLNEFKQDVHSVLFATSSFWYGVDVQGEALSCVIIDKLPFASPNEPIVEARIEDLRQRQEDPFVSYQVPAAIITLKQGLGRLIRSKQDTGILCILDNRILTKQYGRLFLESLPRFPIVQDVAELRLAAPAPRPVAPPQTPAPQPQQPAPPLQTTAPARPIKRPARKSASAWEIALSSKDPKRAKAYSSQDVFAEGELLAHDQFGVGIVTAARPGNKIEVLFKNGFKTLIHDQPI